MSWPPSLQGSYPAAGLCAKDFACSLRYQPEFCCPSGSKRSSSMHRHSGEPYCMLQTVSSGFSWKRVHQLAALWQVGALSTAAGVGGGALFVPLFNSLLEFSKSWRSCVQHVDLISALCSTNLPLQASRTQQQPPKQSSRVELLQVPLLPCFRRTHSIQTSRSYSLILPYC